MGFKECTQLKTEQSFDMASIDKTRATVQDIEETALNHLI